MTTTTTTTTTTNATATMDTGVPRAKVRRRSNAREACANARARTPLDEGLT